MTPIAHMAVTGLAHTPETAVVLGCASHVGLDLLITEYKPDAKAKWIGWCIYQLIGCIVIASLNPLSLCGLIPDAVEVIHMAYRWVRDKTNVWQSGEHLLPFHRPTFKPLVSLGFAGTVILEIGCLILLWAK